jgi:acyl-CoA synthetase (AMP-forming)/AMP-acid ligase II
LSRIAWPSESGECSLPQLLEKRAEQRNQQLFLHDATQSTARSYSFGESCAAMQLIARGLTGLGISRGETVAILAPNGAFLLHALLGVQRCGAVSLVLYPPGITKSSGRGYTAQLLAQLGTCRARSIIVADDLADDALLAALRDSSERPRVVSESYLSQPHTTALPPLPIDPSAVAHVQLTSGSTGRQRGVVLKAGQLVDNAFCIAEGMCQSEADRMVSWLPLAHDMGLIGGVLMPLVKRYPVHLMRPNQFVMRPARWLRAITDFGGTITFSPNFGYQRCVNAIHDHELVGLDLSSLRVAVSAAEPVLGQTVKAFENRFACVGLKPGVVRPAYGLAENTVGATSSTVGAPARFEALAAQDLARGIATPQPPGAPAIHVASVGRPFPGVELSVVDELGRPLNERRVGEVMLRGRMVATGYVADEAASSRTFPGGQRLLTGDLGYLADGELFITGRQKDVIIHAGKNYFPQDLEILVEQVPGVERSAAFGCLSSKSGTEEVIVWAGTKLREQAEQDRIVQACQRAVLDTLGLAIHQVVLVHPSAIPRTTSGKLQRSECRRLHEGAQELSA